MDKRYFSGSSLAAAPSRIGSHGEGMAGKNEERSSVKLQQFLSDFTPSRSASKASAHHGPQMWLIQPWLENACRVRGQFSRRSA
jgi:hypothetical protein